MNPIHRLRPRTGIFVCPLVASLYSRASPVSAMGEEHWLETAGRVFDPAIAATATRSLALPKSGFKAPLAKKLIGELWLADIGVPPALYAGLGIKLEPLFAREEIVRLW